MALQEISSLDDMLKKLNPDERNYVLIYKKGSDASDCSYESLTSVSEKMDKLQIFTVDVTKVKDIHGKYQVSSAPTLLVFEGLDFVKTIKGCNDEKFYQSLFERTLFSAKNEGEVKQQKRVTVYSTPSCSWCTTLKRHLDQHGINYREIDVSKDQKAAEAMSKKSGQQGVPQTDINGQMIVGFDKNRINTLLEITN